MTETIWLSASNRCASNYNAGIGDLTRETKRRHSSLLR